MARPTRLKYTGQYLNFGHGQPEPDRHYQGVPARDLTEEDLAQNQCSLRTSVSPRRMNRHEPGVAATKPGAATPAGRLDRIPLSGLPATCAGWQVFGMGAGVLYPVQARATV
jgi:hypothetical protein